MHMSRDDPLLNWLSHGSQDEDKTLLQRSQRCHVSLHDSDDEGVVRIFVALSCELWGYLFN